MGAVAERRKHEKELIKSYFEECKRWQASASPDASALTMNELLLSYQNGAFGSLLIQGVAHKDCMTDSERAVELVKGGFERLEAFLSDWKVLEAMQLRHSKLGEDFVTSRYSREDLLKTIPSNYHDLITQ